MKTPRQKKAKYIAVFATGMEVALATVKGYNQDDAFASFTSAMEATYGFVPQTYYFGLGEYQENLMPAILPKIYGQVTIN